MIKTNDNGGSDRPGRWLRGELVQVFETTKTLGSGELNTNNFYRFTVTDRTVPEMQEYLLTYVRDYEFTLIAQNVDLRRFEVKNLWANTEGRGYWTLEAVAAIKENWEEVHPLADITTIGFPNTDGNGLGNIWDMSGEFPAGQGAEFQAVVAEAGAQHMDKRKTWYISPAMMTNIENAGGIQSGTFAQLNPNLMDSRLD
jgi:hypothetical protein